MGRGIKSSVSGQPPYPAPQGLIWVQKGKRWQLRTPFGKMTTRLKQQLARQALEREGLIAPEKQRPGAGVYAPPPEPTAEMPAEDPAALPVAPVVPTTPYTYMPVQPGGYPGSGYDFDYGYEYEDEPEYDYYYDEDLYRPGSPVDIGPGTEMTYEPDFYEPEQLSGITDALSWDYWKQKWDATMAELQAHLGKFLGNKKRLQTDRALLTAALKQSPGDPQLKKLLTANQQMMDDQLALEQKLSSMSDKIGQVKAWFASKPDTLGIEPVSTVVVISLIGALGVFAYSIYGQNKKTDQQSVLTAGALSGKLDKGTIAAITGAGGSGGGGIFDSLANMMQSASGLALAGAALWGLYKLKGRVSA